MSKREDKIKDENGDTKLVVVMASFLSTILIGALLAGMFHNAPEERVDSPKSTVTLITVGAVKASSIVCNTRAGQIRLGGELSIKTNDDGTTSVTDLKTSMAVMVINSTDCLIGNP